MAKELTKVNVQLVKLVPSKTPGFWPIQYITKKEAERRFPKLKKQQSKNGEV